MSDIPKNLKYTSSHEWLKVDDDEVIIGITEHAQELLGDLVFVDFPEVGRKVCAGDELGVVESVKAASDYYSPVAGLVVAVNLKVSEDPSLVNQDPYDRGWLVKIQIKNPDELHHLIDAAQYENQIAEEV